jgi:hypothetical protein
MPTMSQVRNKYPSAISHFFPSCLRIFVIHLTESHGIFVLSANVTSSNFETTTRIKIWSILYYDEPNTPNPSTTLSKVDTRKRDVHPIRSKHCTKSHGGVSFIHPPNRNQVLTASAVFTIDQWACSLPPSPASHILRIMVLGCIVESGSQWKQSNMPRYNILSLLSALLTLIACADRYIGIY